VLSHPWLKETIVDGDSDEDSFDPLQKTEPVPPEDKETAMLLDNHSVASNINFVNVNNLFYGGDFSQRLSYTDYCCITEDFTTHHLDEEAIKVVEGFGYPRSFLVRCLDQGDLNHATASYYLQVMP